MQSGIKAFIATSYYWCNNLSLLSYNHNDTIFCALTLAYTRLILVKWNPMALTFPALWKL